MANLMVRENHCQCTFVTSVENTLPVFKVGIEVGGREREREG